MPEISVIMGVYNELNKDILMGLSEKVNSARKLKFHTED